MKKMKKWWWVGLILILVIIAIWWFTSRNNDVSYSTVKVRRGELVQTVNESGVLQPVREVSLNFMNPGRIQDIKIKLGDTVSAGMELASLDSSSLMSRKLEAQAGLQIAEANLSKILAGASGENIAVSEASVSQAKASVEAAQSDLDKIEKTTSENLRQAEKNLADLESDSSATLTPQEQAVSSALTALNNTQKMSDASVSNARSSALISIDDKMLAAKVALDNVNTLLEDDDAEAVLSVKNSSLLNQTKDARLKAINLIEPAEKSALAAKLDDNSISVAAQNLKSLLRQISSLLDYTYAMLEATITSSDFSQQKLDNYKNQISSQSNQINAASNTIENSSQTYSNAVLNRSVNVANANSSWQQAVVALDNAKLAAANNLSSLKLSREQQLTSAESRLDSARQGLVSAKAQLNSTAAPARYQDIALARAQVTQAQANLAGVEQQISDSMLLAPLDGVVTALNYEIGEQYGLGSKPMIVILVNNNFNVEVDIAESNISKIKIGDEADISFDALDDEFILKGKVSFIEPAQTLIQEVVYYKVKIEFINLESDLALNHNPSLSLKAGMTSNVSIITDVKEGVLQVPSRTVISKDNARIVRVLINNKVEEREVVVGLRGDDGLIEIISGLSEGEDVVTFIKE